MVPNVEYNEEKHEYTFDGKAVPSVTQLVKQFLRLDTSWLEAHPQYAERGTLIHNELAEYYRNERDEETLSPDAKRLARFVGARSEQLKAEVLLWNTEHEYAGTADIVEISPTDPRKIVAIYDFKTGRNPNKKYCRVQLNLYRLALENMGFDIEDTVMMVIYPSGTLSVSNSTWEDMASLQKDDLSPDEDTVSKIEALEEHLESLSFYVQSYEEAEKELKRLMLELFESNNAGKYTGGSYAFSYAPSSVRKSLDTAKVKEALSDRVTEFMKETTIAPTVRIKKITEGN